MKIVFSLLIIVAYLLLDALTNSKLLSISFMDALLFNYEKANPLINIIISLLIFSMGFLTNKKTSQETEPKKDAIFEANKRISQIVMSSMPIQKQLSDISKTLQSSLGIEISFVALYDKDSIIVQNIEPYFQNFDIKQTYAAHKEGLLETSLDYLLATCFIEKRESMNINVQIKNSKHTLKAFAHALISHESSKPFGLFVMLSSKPDDFSLLAQSVADFTSFALSLAKKKEANLKFQEQIASKDEVLNIPTNTILQAKIEREFKRHQRYKTHLSLIIIQIDHIENLSNIFEESAITKLKKELVSIIQKNIRLNDLFGKWTGERFAIVASDIEFQSAKQFAQKIARLISLGRFSKVGKVTCSYGVTSLGENDTISTLRTRAEAALNEAIRKGGNCIEVKVLV